MRLDKPSHQSDIEIERDVLRINNSEEGVYTYNHLSIRLVQLGYCNDCMKSNEIYWHPPATIQPAQPSKQVQP